MIETTFDIRYSQSSRRHAYNSWLRMGRLQLQGQVLPEIRFRWSPGGVRLRDRQLQRSAGAWRVTIAGGHRRRVVLVHGAGRSFWSTVTFAV